MKMKKVSRVLSLALAGAMMFAMAPAAFAAATDGTDHFEYEPASGTTHQVWYYHADGTKEDCGTTPCVWIDGKCICGNTEQTASVEPVGPIYTPVDSTHHHVYAVYEDGYVQDEDVSCSFGEDGKCVCGNKKAATDTSDCDHSGNNWYYEDLGNGTHNVVCKDCGETVTLGTPCVYTDGKCICGAEEEVCDHSNNNWKYEDNGDGTHKVICADCDTVVAESTPCVYTDGKCICGSEEKEEVGTTYTPIDATHHHVHAVYEDGTVYDADVDCVFETGSCVCGNTKPACDHMQQHFKFVSNNDGTHNVLCADCDAVLSENVPCEYNEDGVCTICGAEKPACDHMGQHFKFVANNDGTHNVLCADCDAVLSENVPCEYNEDGVCTICGAEKPACDHMGQHFKFVANNDGTHNVLCADCDAVLSENVPCEYGEDGVCTICGAKKTTPTPDPVDPDPVDPDPTPDPVDPDPTPAPSLDLVPAGIGLGGLLLAFGSMILAFFGL